MCIRISLGSKGVLMATHKRAHDKPNSAQRMESDYSEDFEEEEVVGSAAIPSSKPSARSLSVQRRSLEGMARRRRKEIPRPSVQTYGTPNRRLAAASQSTTKSKSTGTCSLVKKILPTLHFCW